MQTGQERARNQAGHEVNPTHHTQQMKQRLQETADHLRKDVEKITEPKAMALFEASAEVLDGLVRAFDHYENKSERAWKT